MQKRFSCTVILCAWLAACGSAPVEPGYYRVMRGDTLTRIARAQGQSVRDLTRWNRLGSPDTLEVGQVLRVAPPALASAGAAGGADAGRAPAPPRAASPTPHRPAAGAALPAAAALRLVWPASGPVIGRFDNARNKGIDIAGVSGAPVAAAEDGTVVYAGNRLRGYGNLLIIKHNDDFLTAYAHNRALLVAEGARVARGQRIAEMGDTDSTGVMLHFEVRYRGRSVDPMRYLPARQP
jgi:lipoprotein YgeR